MKYYIMRKFAGREGGMAVAGPFDTFAAAQEQFGIQLAFWKGTFSRFEYLTIEKRKTDEEIRIEKQKQTDAARQMVDDAIRRLHGDH